MSEIRGEHLYRINQDGFPIMDNPIIAYFKGDELLDEVEQDVIKTSIPEGLYRPRWDGTEWIEDMTQEELDELNKPEPYEPTKIDVLEAKNKALADRQEFIEDIIAEMAMMIYD